MLIERLMTTCMGDAISHDPWCVYKFIGWRRLSSALFYLFWYSCSMHVKVGRLYITHSCHVWSATEATLTKDNLRMYRTSLCAYTRHAHVNEYWTCNEMLVYVWKWFTDTILLHYCKYFVSHIRLRISFFQSVLVKVVPMWFIRKDYTTLLNKKKGYSLWLAFDAICNRVTLRIILLIYALCQCDDEM